MTGPDHYMRAEQLIDGLDGLDTSDPEQAQIARDNLALAQLHATLALTAATAAGAPSGTSAMAGWIETGALDHRPTPSMGETAR